MQVILYNNNAERNKVDKTLFLTSPIELFGTLKFECSITNPVIEVQSSGLITSNYAFIEEFNRYYFIDEIVSVKNNLWRISMTVDVLMSFKNEIRQLSGVKVTRSSLDNITLKEVICDDKLPLGNICKIDLISDTTNRVIKGYAFYSCQYIVVATTTSIVNGYLDPIDYLRVGAMVSPLNNNIRVYLFSESNDYMAALQKISSDDTINQYLISCGSLPYSPNDFTEVEQTDKISVGNKTITLDSDKKAYMLKPSSILNNNTFEVNVEVNEKILTYSNCKIYLFLPAYGLVELPRTFLVYNENIYLKYTLKYNIDFTNGSLTYFLLTPDNRYYKTYSCYITATLPVNRSNEAEVKRNETANELKTVSEALNVFGSSLSGNPFKLVGGAIKEFSLIPNQFAREELNVVKGGTTFDGKSTLALLTASGQTYSVIMYVDSTGYEEYHNKFGYACSAIVNIENCTGYIEVSEVHLENITTALGEELSKIETELKNGVLL